MKSSGILKRLEELDRERLAVLETENQGDSIVTSMSYVDNQLFQKWCTKVRALLRQLGDAGWPQYAESFENESRATFVGMTNLMVLRNVSAVFLAAKEDCENGWLTQLGALLRAQVFDDELEQAEELNANGYAAPAAVIGRVVLETALRSLCQQHGVASGKLARMNDDLRKADRYDAITHKRVTLLSAIGNSAAHNLADFNPQDVAGMLDGVRRFLEEYKA